MSGFDFVRLIRQHDAAVPLRDELEGQKGELLPVHDEIIAHVPEEDAERVARLIEKHMTDHPALTKIVPITAEAQIVDRWSDAKEPGYVPDYIKED